MSHFSSILNSIGLICDFIGVVGLFFLRNTGLQELIDNKIEIITEESKAFIKTEGQIEDLIARLNYEIARTNHHNEEVFHRAKRWQLLIVTGFLLQLIASFGT